ncbi:wHTH domain-containing protein [Actinomadura sp. 3N407]|uniref:wHTH domain-containing protein n=1 Tax=Actinomadura sp. 3N407 TaxID=3457423 RepID=UPI003FCE42EA
MGRGQPIDQTNWPKEGPHRRLLEHLDKIHQDNGQKSRRDIAAAMHIESASYINDFLRGLRLPLDPAQLSSLVRALGGGEDDARDAVRLYEKTPKHQPDPAPHPWVRQVSEHIAWTLVDPQRDASTFREATIAVAERLSALCGEAEAALDDDPWLDGELAERFTKWTEWLLRTSLSASLRDLSPAEAALLVLVPLLHHVHMVRTLAGLREIDPLDFNVDAGEGARRDYETFLGGQRELVDRAKARSLPDRDTAGPEIGWWLFHRWVARFPRAYALGAVREVLSKLEIADRRMRDEVLGAKTVQRFLAALRLDLSELGDTDRKNAPQFETVLFAGEPHEQRVRELLIGQILTAAYSLTIDLVRLPDIVVRHLGIPHPVDLAELRETATSRAKWVLQSDCLILRADCHHPAELEGLHQYASQVDALLHTIRQGCGDHSTMQVLTRLPSRATADDVRPGADDDGRLLFQRVSRFRLDERRVQDLLMGEQLYQDRGLAVRELYQNALDACRYRRARHAYRGRGDWLDDWEGRIHFLQGVDENGRDYLECRDNGIGMTEAVLTDVFSQAGTRFTDTTEFLVESADWQSADPPIPFHPNSRFGIGVLSYFMIADEIDVITRPLDRGHRPHPTLKVSIFGPGHLFRIEHLPIDHSPGTSVKLYLRDGEDAPSCVEELRRLLGIAEFRTVAEHGSQSEVWEPAVLKPRVRPSWETDGLNVHGRLVPWTAPDGGGQVVWCEKGGGILVDGIYVQPAVRRGIFAGLEKGTLRGAVVNLTGQRVPERLSVDRRSVLSDASEDAEHLLRSAMSELIGAGRPLLHMRWVSGVTEASPRLGDIISEAAAAARIEFVTRTGAVDIARVGCFLQDSHLVQDGDDAMQEFREEGANYWHWDFGPYMNDHVLLWRLAAHGSESVLTEQAETPGPVQRALPSDIFLLGFNEYIHPEISLSMTDWEWTWDDVRSHPGHILWVALLTGATPRDVARRALELGIVEIEPERFGVSADSTDLVVLSEERSGRPRWLDLADPVPLGHVVAVALQFGIGLRELRDRLEGYGHRLPSAAPTMDVPTSRDLRLLSWHAGEVTPINGRPQPLPASHVVRSARDLDMPVSDVCERLAAFDFRAEALSLPNRPSEEDGKLFDWRLGDVERDEFDPRAPLAPAHLARASIALGLPVPEVAARLAAYGVPVPDRLPDRVADRDLTLLSRDGDAGPGWWSADEEISVPSLLVISTKAEVDPEYAAARLAEYGLRVPNGPFPAKPDEATLRLLSRNFGVTGRWLDPKQPVPRGHLVRASVELGIGPRTAAERLAVCGMLLPAGDIPEAAIPADLVLLRYSQNYGTPWLDADEPVSLLHLLKVSRKTGISVREAAERLRWLGMDVPDVDESVAEALRRLPRVT